jgi:protein-tyrosine-phosphatase
MEGTERQMLMAGSASLTSPAEGGTGWAPFVIGRVVGGIRRRLAEAAAGRVARRDRRNPGRLLAALGGVRRVLILCHGNIIRSPYTERVLARALGQASGVTVRSAGLHAVPGTLSPVAPVVAAEAFDVDLRGHSSSLVTSDAIADADVVFVMDVPQLAAMHRRFPDARHKTFLLASLAPDTPLEVRDPVMGGQAVCQNCFDHINRAVRPLVRALSQHPSHS